MDLDLPITSYYMISSLLILMCSFISIVIIFPRCSIAIIIMLYVTLKRYWKWKDPNREIRRMENN